MNLIKKYQTYRYLLYGLGVANTSVKTFFDKNDFQYDVYIDGDGTIDLSKFDIIIKSPGINPDSSLLIDANNLMIPVICDLELFSLIYPCTKLIVVTGTNGKTSTVRMLTTIINKKYKCYLGGNVGLPLFALQSDDDFTKGYVVVEASSYMLNNCFRLKPYIYIVLNISNHHLTYHKTFKNYKYQKLKIIDNLTSDNLLIIPAKFNNLVHNHSVKIINSDCNNLNLKIQNNCLLLNKEGLFKLDNNVVIPNHQLQNMLVASIVGLCLGINPSKIKEALSLFKYDPYRLEVIYTSPDTIIINDAKATNWDATIKAIESINKGHYELHLLLGGLGPSFSENKEVDKHLNYIDKIYLTGSNKDDIIEDLIKLGYHNYYVAELEDALKTLCNDSNPKIILYSPAAQSFDQFQNYEERGNYFNHLIKNYWLN